MTSCRETSCSVGWSSD